MTQTDREINRCRHTERHKDIQTDRETEAERNIFIHIYRERKRRRQTDRQTHYHRGRGRREGFCFLRQEVQSQSIAESFSW